MPYCLDVRIVDFERAVMGTSLLHIHREEESMMVDPFLFPVYMHESRNFHPIWSCEKICSFQVEILGIELVCRLKI